MSRDIRFFHHARSDLLVCGIRYYLDVGSEATVMSKFSDLQGQLHNILSSSPMTFMARSLPFGPFRQFSRRGANLSRDRPKELLYGGEGGVS